MPPETSNNALNHKTARWLTDAIFYLAILFFIIGFNFSDVMVGNWYQQFLPNIGSKQINDIIFLDSLNGFAIASRNINPDTSSIIRTTNGGDNWQIIQTLGSRRFSRIKFINNLTGFISGGSGSGTPYLYKTIDGGSSWNIVPGATLGNAYWGDMSVLNNDTLWLVDSDGLTGGVYRTTDGGTSWQQQLNLGSQNPGKIYMYNNKLGFVSTGAGLYRSTNSGLNWNPVPGMAFLDMYFSDSLTGWKNNAVATFFQKTTDGGLNWITYNLPAEEGIIVLSRIIKFDNVFKDTIFGVGSQAFFGSGQFRGLIYKSTESGQNWGNQIPDTSIHSGQYKCIQFIDKRNGWAYWNSGGIHTTNGGDTTFFTLVEHTSSEVPKDYTLYQNYPNPFNPATSIKFKISKTRMVILKIYDIRGKETAVLVNEELKPGEYKTEWNASGYSSGVYFYSLIINGVTIDTKRMILLK